DELLEELETLLITSDVGLDATTHLLDVLRERVRRERIEDPARLRDVLKEELTKLIAPLEKPLDLDAHKPFIIMIAGVN
ncbi:signal recognition particle receptor subunit alpha, partial [Klebsiella pneumoniae]|nr:signal recognition particle receptor subunit alpha [Klebsiella pneumoniae]